MKNVLKIVAGVLGAVLAVFFVVRIFGGSGLLGKYFNSGGNAVGERNFSQDNKQNERGEFVRKDENDLPVDIEKKGDVEIAKTKDAEAGADKKEVSALNESEQSEEEISEKESDKLPEEVLLEVPFSSQAPLGVWDEYHEEACEEASLVMVKYYLDGKKTISREQMEKEIQNLIKFQLDNYGDYKDSDMRELVRLAQEFYGMDNLKVVYDFKKGDLKKWLAQGSPIIAPTAGRLLGNPYFTPPGPLYHNLVLIGYSGDKIITNDPGTRRGEKYEYNLDILYEAIHDFPGEKNDIEKGRKAVVVISNDEK